MVDPVPFAGDLLSVRWQPLFQTCSPAAPVTRVRYALSQSDSFARPVKVRCEDGDIYWLKGAEDGRSTYIDHVVSLLGLTMGAPVAHVAIIEVPEQLRHSRQLRFVLAMQGKQPGPAHGSRNIPECQVIRGFRPAPPEGGSLDYRRRAALLCVLFGCAAGADHQFLYANHDDEEMYSFDHNLFLGGDDWSVQSLESMLTTQRPGPDPAIYTAAKLTRDVLKPAVSSLAAVTDHELARIVCSPPVEWGVSDTERAAVASFIRHRRDHLTRQYIDHEGPALIRRAEEGSDAC